MSGIAGGREYSWGEEIFSEGERGTHQRQIDQRRPALHKEYDVRAGKETCDCGAGRAVKSAQAMESRSREMAKTLGQTKVGGNIMRRLWAEAK